MLNYVFSSSEREKGPFLVVVPLTTIEHWRREVEAWTDMNLCMYHDNGGRDMRDLIREYEWYYSGRYGDEPACIIRGPPAFYVLGWVCLCL